MAMSSGLSRRRASSRRAQRSSTQQSLGSLLLFHIAATRLVIPLRARRARVAALAAAAVTFPVASRARSACQSARLSRSTVAPRRNAEPRASACGSLLGISSIRNVWYHSANMCAQTFAFEPTPTVERPRSSETRLARVRAFRPNRRARLNIVVIRDLSKTACVIGGRGILRPDFGRLLAARARAAFRKLHAPLRVEDIVAPRAEL